MSYLEALRAQPRDDPDDDDAPLCAECDVELVAIEDDLGAQLCSGCLSTDMES